MHPPGRLGHARRLVIGFAAIAGGLTIALGLLTWRFLALGVDLDQQRIRQRLETVADGAASTVGAGVAEAERWLMQLLEVDAEERPRLAAQLSEALPADSVILILTGTTLAAHPRDHLLYQPVAARTSGTAGSGFAGTDWDRRFARVDVFEYQERNLEAAAAALRGLAQSGDPDVRAKSLLRLARLLRRLGDHDTALAAYDEMAGLNAAWIEDLPAPLLAAYNRCELLESLDRTAELGPAAEALLVALQSGRWPLAAPVYRFYTDRVARWVAPDHPAASAPPDREALAEAVDAIWRARDDVAGNGNGWDEQPTRRSVVWSRDVPFVTMEARHESVRAVLVAGPQTVERWTSPLALTRERQGVDIQLVDSSSGRTMSDASGIDGPAVASPGDDRLRVVRTAIDTGLPWALYVSSTSRSADVTGRTMQRNLLLVGLTLIVSIVFAGVYFISRAVNRELAVARLQSDFVAAVSHEFRSPLTSMRHLIELLSADRVPDDATRTRFYTVLEREAGRLQRLVEQLLDFRRLDEGAAQFDMQPVDPVALVEEVAAGFRDDAVARGVTLEVAVDRELPVVRGDRAALARTLWNLLENAVRYSPDCPTVWLEAARAGAGHVAIAVRDRGVGIPEDEQASIFRKFVRGGAARRLGARGTGLGLAMVEEIVRAHGGAVSLESEVGRGSTFTVTLPVGEVAS